MADTVFILGAGASREGGAPLMRDFLQRAESLMLGKRVEKWERDFLCVYRAIARLKATHSNSNLDLTNIEEVFAALEMSRLIGALPSLEEGLDAVIASLRRLIGVTLEQSLCFERGQRGHGAPRPYPLFADLLNRLTEWRDPECRVAVMTFNYDVCLDWACAGLGVDYGLEETEVIVAPRRTLPLLKLHGSLNWVRCEECHKVAVASMVDSIRRAEADWSATDRLDLDDDGDADPGSALIVSTEWLFETRRCETCGTKLDAGPFLVAPTPSKAQDHVALSAVWKRARRELAEARNVFVCGYSFPQSDSFFRMLWALGTIGDASLRTFWICDPEAEAVEPRFRAMLGPAAARLIEVKPLKFAQAIPEIEKRLGSLRPR